MDLFWRGLTRADAPAMADVHSAAAIVDGTGDLRSSADMAEVFIRQELGGTKRRYFGAFDARERLVAFSVLFARTSLLPQHQMHLWGTVDPKHRRLGIGTELLRRAVDAAPGLHAEVFPDAPLEIMFAAPDGIGCAELAALAGFAPWRWNLTMTRALDTERLPARPVVPDGLTLRGFRPADEHELLAAYLEDFVPDHPGITAPTAAMWGRRLASLSFLPDLSFLMLDPAAGRIAGYVLTNLVPRHPDHPDRRAVNLTTIGTRRRYRRRGVAAGVIAATLRGAAELGYAEATVNVDADNPTGALSVYERAGFRVHGRTTLYVRSIPI